jgi:hypothetical protein
VSSADQRSLFMRLEYVALFRRCVHKERQPPQPLCSPPQKCHPPPAGSCGSMHAWHAAVLETMSIMSDIKLRF